MRSRHDGWALRPRGDRRPALRAQRRGVALLAALLVVAIASLLVVQMLTWQTAEWASERNTADYERALYLAGAGAHHALAELEADPDWRGTVSEGVFPLDDSYSAIAVSGLADEVVITSTGVAGEATRRVQVTVSLGG